MSTHVLRVWLPDRPGALGAVASRIGAVRGDLVGIDILERDSGLVIDELVVDLPDDDLLPLLLKEVGEVDGVEVEDVRPTGSGSSVPDPRLAALETAALLVSQETVAALMEMVVANARRDFEADWAAVVDCASGVAAAEAGNSPAAGWLRAFLAGGRSSQLLASGDVGPDDVAWTELPSAGLAIVLGRHGLAFRARERRQLGALGRIADQRWRELAARVSRQAHPSRMAG
jgi:hypothetical protein